MERERRELLASQVNKLQRFDDSIEEQLKATFGKQE
jgi:hypothetical protein